MSFTPNIPTTGQTLGGTKDLIKNNFSALRETISNSVQPNHTDVLDTGAGKHIFVQMPVQTSSSSNLPAAGEGGLITKTVHTNSELFYVRDGVNNYIQLTQGTPQIAASGFTFLPGGIIIQWDSLGATANGTVITFPTTFSTSCFTVQVTNTTASTLQLVGAKNITQSGFTFSTIGGGTPFTYIAIGV